MAGRKRAYSDISGDETETIQRVKCLTEKATLKPVAKGLDPNDWPCFVLEDACVYRQDGKTIANMLHAELCGPFIVRGKLAVEHEDRKCLLCKKFQGQYIEISNCQGFSIGYDPTVLWASGKAGWFEIQPSTEYEPIYSKMVEGIALYFSVTLLFEELMETSKKNYKSLSADQVLLKYATSDGTGLVKAEVEQRFRDHAEFLLSQMGKPSGGGGVNWKATNFYKWMVAGHPDVVRRIKDKSGETDTKDTAEVREPGDVVVRNVVISEAPKPKTIKHVSRPKLATQSRRAPSIPPLELDDSKATSPTAIILQILNYNIGDRHKLTLPKIGTELYYKYSISKYHLGQEVVKVHAKSVFEALTDDWKDTPIYKTLKDHLTKNQPKSELYAEALNVQLHRRAQKSDALEASCNSKNASSQQSSHAGKKQLSRAASNALLDSTESPEPHPSTGKSLPPTLSARRSGKEAGLRLASSPTKRPHSPNTSEEGDEPAVRSRQRKRRRPSLEIEMGSPLEDAETPPSQNDDEAGIDVKFKIEKDTIMGIVAEPLPTLEPTGPNGLWRCHKEGCGFIVRSADEKEGKRKIQEHFNEHADLIARENLVLQEARPHLPVSHLLDKLRKLGEEANKNDQMSRPTINGVVVPQPIKRQGMTI